MALATPQILQDSRWRTIIKGTFSGTTGATILMNVSDLLGWVTGSKTNLAMVSWSASSPIQLIWTGASAKPCINLTGSGTYGGSNGGAAIANDATGAHATLGDMTLESAAASVGFVVIVCHKVELTVGHGNGWTA